MQSFNSRSGDENRAAGRAPKASHGGDQRLEFQARTAAETSPAIGRLVSLNGTHGVVDCRLDPTREDWSVGDLITITHRGARLVGVILEVTTLDPRWSEGEENFARVTFELGGEIVHRPPDAPVFERGVSAYPPLGATVRRITDDDLRSIYTLRGKRGTEVGRLSQNTSIPSRLASEETVERNFLEVLHKRD